MPQFFQQCCLLVFNTFNSLPDYCPCIQFLCHRASYENILKSPFRILSGPGFLEKSWKMSKPFFRPGNPGKNYTFQLMSWKLPLCSVKWGLPNYEWILFVEFLFFDFFSPFEIQFKQLCGNRIGHGIFVILEKSWKSHWISVALMAGNPVQCLIQEWSLTNSTISGMVPGHVL